MRPRRGGIQNEVSPCRRCWQPILQAFEELAWHARWVADGTAAPTLLIVEDDRALSAMLSRAVHRRGLPRSTSPTTAQQGLHRGLTGDYDAMIVDRGLPVMDGVELVAVLRSRGIVTPILAADRARRDRRSCRRTRRRRAGLPGQAVRGAGTAGPDTGTGAASRRSDRRCGSTGCVWIGSPAPSVAAGVVAPTSNCPSARPRCWAS